MVEGGNEERCGGLGHLSGGGGSSRGVVLRLLFSALVIVNEAFMGLNECHQLGVGPRVVGRECLTTAWWTQASLWGRLAMRATNLLVAE